MARGHRSSALGLEGATVWITGLPAAGKSTLAAALATHLVDLRRPAHVLDGNELRKGLNADLGFSPADRRENVRRTAQVARLMAEAGTVAVVAIISPYRTDRAAARKLHEETGLRFVEVWVSTPLAECERRDPEGLYARARAGELTQFTGVDDPYEPPDDPEVTASPEIPIQTTVEQITELLERSARAGAPGAASAPSDTSAGR